MAFSQKDYKESCKKEEETGKELILEKREK